MIRGKLGKDFSNRGLLLFLVITLGLVVRVFLAPYSAGSDLAQFRGFADTFTRHGLCFYRYSTDWAGEGWPYDWPYVYGPVWMYILGLLAYISSGGVDAYWVGDHYYVYIDPGWAVTVKSLLITADTVDAILVYLVVSRRSRGLTPVAAAALYYLNPMTIYISSIYGMFDQLALVFVLAALLLYDREKISPFLLGFASSVKQTALPVLASLSVHAAKEGRLTRFSIYALAGLAVPFLPVLLFCPSSITQLLKAFEVTGSPHYTLPLAYSFNGVSSLATYLHLRDGGDYTWMIKLWILPFALLTLYLAVAIIKRNLDPVVIAAISYIVFTATYWRVNHQYLVPLIALVLSSLPLLDRKGKLLALALALWVGVWPIVFPTSWWFHVHIKDPDTGMINLVDKLTLMVFDDRFYVVYGMVLTLLQYLFILYALSSNSGRRANSLSVT